MKTSEFDYNLPEELIATMPASPRDSARLLVLDRKTGDISDSVFRDLVGELGSNDVLVLNRSKVIPARLHALVNGRSHEILLVRKRADGSWETWVHGGKKLLAGQKINFTDGLYGEYLGREEEIFIFKFNLEGDEFAKELISIGEMPIPPYILKARRHTGMGEDSAVDTNEYQTVYAKTAGSVAAPTAGLHFTEELLAKLHSRGVQIEYVTLHVGLGTFQPLNVDEVENFKIHSEYYEIDNATAESLNRAKAAGKRIVAVGTTSVRVLESAAENYQGCGIQNPGGLKNALLPKSGETSIYIYPGYEFKFVDAIITNFHLPKSSLILLVSAFAGAENIKKAYSHAIEKRYRFYSYGDAMLLK